jgi:arylsulfatase A
MLLSCQRMKYKTLKHPPANKTMKQLRTLLIAITILAQGVNLTAVENTKPNIVYILADDLGYGDVQCFNPNRGKIATPQFDKMAAQGMVFTDAHTSSSVCTPTRYGLLTGRYNWRTHLQSSVLNGFSEPLIAADRLTVPAFLKQQGYSTACIGKWHLGMGIAKDQPSPVITDGPTTRGFDRFFGISASLDMPPFAFIENDRFTEPLTTTKKWQRTGPAAASFEAVDVLPTLTKKAVELIKTQATASTPFFLYMPLNSPHTPIEPSNEWRGKSGISSYADFVMETDWAVGEVLAAIDQAGIGSNTLVVLTSDNGCSPAAKIPELQAKGHYPNGDLRGMKADVFDGGHRVPFIVRWPDRVKAGSRSDQTICHIDLMATCAGILGKKLPDNAGEDSVSILPALLGTDTAPLHEAIVHHSINGSFAIRQGKWKLDLCADSGGWSDPKPNSAEVANLPINQLYDLSTDLAESKNLQAEYPEEVVRLTKLLEKTISDGRSTPGPKQTNDAKIEVRKKTTNR